MAKRIIQPLISSTFFDWHHSSLDERHAC